MQLNELKKGFWGYKKESVYRYIVAIEESTSEKLAEKDAKLTQLEEQSQKKILELEATVDALREENAALKEHQVMAFSTLLEAQRHAQFLKEESAGRERKAQEELDAAVERQDRRLEEYAEKIRQLQKAIQGLLAEFGGKVDDMEESLAVLQSQAPAHVGISLFPQKSGSEGEEEPWKKYLSI